MAQLKLVVIIFLALYDVLMEFFDRHGDQFNTVLLRQLSGGGSQSLLKPCIPIRFMYAHARTW